MPGIVNLKEYIHPEMDILFLALNAPEISNRNGHWFSRNLRFWNLLYKSGLITERMEDKLLGDITVFGGQKINFQNRIYGVTDLNRDVVETRGSLVETNANHVLRILKILDSNQVNKLCLMHANVAKAFDKYGLIRRRSGRMSKGYGMVGQHKNTEIYEMPFPGTYIPGMETYYSILIGNISENEKPEEIADIKIEPNRNGAMDRDKTGTIFYLPDSGNSITEKDISKAVLRITVGPSIWFPSRSLDVQVTVKNVTETVPFEKRSGRSHLLKIGRNLMGALSLKPNGRLKFTKLRPSSFLIEKV